MCCTTPGPALLGGVGGSLLFGAAGVVLSIPFLLRVHRHCGNWRIPALLLVTFATVFSVSTFVVGPAISGSDEPTAPAIEPGVGVDDHDAHH
jgi:O-antigen/teichoic acid export membrane protein